MHITMMQNLRRLLGDSANERPRHEAVERPYQGGATCVKCEEGIRTTASPLTFNLVSLDRVVIHVVDNDGCVLTR